MTRQTLIPFMPQLCYLTFEVSYLGGHSMNTEFINMKPAICFAFLASASALDAHPHVFIDGGVDVYLDEDGMLHKVEVTWLYDKFETLYILSSQGISPKKDGRLNSNDLLVLNSFYENWPPDFDGSVHLKYLEQSIDLNWPQNASVTYSENRLKVKFERELKTKFALTNIPLEIGFYERTYFFDFTITSQPLIFGDAGNCNASVIPFEINSQSADILRELSYLGREEIPEDTQIGAKLADRIQLKCD